MSLVTTGSYLCWFTNKVLKQIFLSCALVGAHESHGDVLICEGIAIFVLCYYLTRHKIYGREMLFEKCRASKICAGTLSNLSISRSRFFVAHGIPPTGGKHLSKTNYVPNAISKEMWIYLQYTTYFNLHAKVQRLWQWRPLAIFFLIGYRFFCCSSTLDSRGIF